MKRIIFSVFAFILSASLLAQTPSSAEWTTYGKKMTTTKTVPVTEALKDVPNDGKTVAVEGVISDVCTNKGCWLIMTDGKQQLRVQFEGYSFFVPWEAKGKKIKAQGVVKIKTVDEKTAKHWAEEQSNPEVKPEDVKGEQKVYIMTASGVAIAGGGAISKAQQDAIAGKKKMEGHDEH
ncbi:MAG: DUF4920 domain-containing protein [candidate division KSB1 bacterium]|nr:DUF4920 domain-containing protein [candidate division KSB1 bacterium]MDZ7303080.1 DUF4920 domain-containing protein [candidate division KSB1 bacterium]MDZ7312619.1 DUF4920 domain-containing protein [candidate division KSB1 bacterium]